MNTGLERLLFYITRAAIVMLWVGIIAIFLYSPYVSQFFADQNSINIYTWADIFSEGDISQFEAETGIKVNLVYYDNSEELMTKLDFSKGRGYDMLLSGDSNIPDLVNKGILGRIDQSKLDFWHALEPNLLNLPYDPMNRYSIPYSWDVYGVGINLAKFNSIIPPASWQIIFDPTLKIKNVGMMEEGLRSISIAIQYLYGKVEHLNEKQIDAVKDLLLKQKESVVVYTELLGDYLLFSGTSPAVATQAAYVKRIMNMLDNGQQLKFIIPKEGGFIATENFCIFSGTKKEDLVYRFINFMFQKSIVSRFATKTIFLPTRRDVLESLDLDYLGGIDYLLNPETFQKFALFKYIMPRDIVSRVWIEVKAS